MKWKKRIGFWNVGKQKYHGTRSRGLLDIATLGNSLAWVRYPAIVWSPVDGGTG
jgi:hypothetical protein